MEAYGQCLEFNPTRHEAHRNLADCLLRVRRDAALYPVRRHLNQSIELRENIPKQKNPGALEQDKALLLELEGRINQVFRPRVKTRYSQKEMVDILSRPITRGGLRLYDGPRLALLVFRTNQSRLTSKARDQLKVLARALRDPRLSSASFCIEGHADGRGSAHRNLELSRLRAFSIQKYLMEKEGISPDRLTVQFHGEDHPIFPNDSKLHHHYNRRMEIVRRIEP